MARQIRDQHSKIIKSKEKYLREIKISELKLHAAKDDLASANVTLDKLRATVSAVGTTLPIDTLVLASRNAGRRRRHPTQQSDHPRRYRESGQKSRETGSVVFVSPPTRLCPLRVLLGERIGRSTEYADHRSEGARRGSPETERLSS